ncbi:Sodium/calcium exchanger protein-domain-containing protein [Diplogelasinospora grovesii]|uniref:Sodium/calcium exchanger protein-domain-containing protein n=1 Tax=Diplogelasinospora grovesii TaxID=303347 RepID=A0AAN6N6L7_9PEZI|nr:Sodium/calcium exchanger protein-domain-containing protein [Diplogelasinospora grovesii]
MTPYPTPKRTFFSTNIPFKHTFADPAQPLALLPRSKDGFSGFLINSETHRFIASYHALKMQISPYSKRSRYSSRPFVISTLLVTLIATCALFVRRPNSFSNRESPLLATRDLRESDVECRAVHQAADQCAFILANCEDDEAGLLHYLTFYYCTLGNARPVAFIILVGWLGLLFTTIGIAASDFFSVNLSTIASVLGLSESLAGVTFLAFGNGSPDVFSTFAAMGSNSGSMAVGELLGAAGFITAVVAGSMALVREFKVSKRTFVRDICFFIVAISFTMAFLADGKLYLWECCIMIGFYLFYVVVVVGWHWYTARRRRRRMRDAAARSHVYSAAGRISEELEPYRDEVDDDDAAPVGGRSGSAPEAADISMLERITPRVEIDDTGITPTTPDEEDEDREIHVAAEVTSSMRVNRPRWGRSNTTITPIRPSLVGVLEFRSVLASLHKARNMHLGPLPGRAYTAHPHRRLGSVDQSIASLTDPRAQQLDGTSPSPGPYATRERALSSGNAPLNLENAGLPRPGFGPDLRLSPDTRQSSINSRTIGGRLAPPTSPPTQQPPSPGSPRFLQIQIPSPGGGSSGHSSPSLSPFPGLSESPAVLTPLPPPEQQSSATMFPFPVERVQSSIPGLDDNAEHPKPINWWPYRLLPPPHVILGTLFPTLQGWKEKSWWDKIMSLISVPSVFILVTTLPVVENDSHDDESEPDIAAAAQLAQPGHVVLPMTTNDLAPAQQETEWQEFRRRTRSISSRSPLSMSPLLGATDTPHSTGQVSGGVGQHASAGVTSNPVKPTPDSAPNRASTSTEEGPAWNRWLVALQLFTGPLFTVFIVWANIVDDLEQPGKTLVKLVLYSLLVSLCLFVILLLTTTPDKKPKYHFLLCFLGFIISVAWISTVAGEVVGVLKAFGVILGISEAILGLTIFAVGNSLGDLVADVTVARLGYPVMALSACFGGPMLNILLGIGIGGAWMGITSANEKHHKHPENPLRYKPYHLQVGVTLMVSAITVLLTLLVLLVVVPSNRWMMSRKIGWGLIGIWTVGTIVNLVVEVTGLWSEVS